MFILGIDPGLRVTGYGFIEAKKGNLKLIEAGIIKTSHKDNLSLRLGDIYNNITKVIKQLRPEALVLEKLYSHRGHPATVILLAHCRGVICLVATLRQIPLFEYSNTRIKKALLGRGNASKYQLQGMVGNLLGLKKIPEPQDVADALALAIGHAYMANFDQILEKLKR